MKLSKALVVGLVSVVALTACGKQQEKNNDSGSKQVRVSKRAGHPVKKTTKKTDAVEQSKSVKHSSSTSSTASSEKKPAALWNQDKAKQLQSFMTGWGRSMKQQYESYTPGNSVNYYGISEPDLMSSMPPALNNQKISIAWSDDGQSNADYALVAVYSDAVTAPDMDAHLYFFVIHAGQPMVLITQQDQGNDNNWLYFSVTANKDLQNGFARIILSK